MFLNLPHEIIIVILSQYCDGLSLATLLHTFEGNGILNSIIRKCYEIKVSSLSSRGTYPERNSRLPNQSSCMLELSDVLKFNEHDNKRSILDKLSIISFFEDHTLQVATPSHVEIPLWCGQLQLKLRANIDVGVLVVTPTCFWNHRLANEWRRSFSNSGLNLSVTSRDVYPSQLIARIKGATATDGEILLQIAEYLNETNQVLHEQYISSPMNLIIMSRSKAISKLSETKVQSTAVMSSLNYDCHHTNGTPFMKKSPLDNISDNKTNELFVFQSALGCFNDSRSSLNMIKHDLTNLIKVHAGLNN